MLHNVSSGILLSCLVLSAGVHATSAESADGASVSSLLEDVGDAKEGKGEIAESAEANGTTSSSGSPLGRTAIIAELVGLSTLKGFALLAFPALLLIPIFFAALLAIFLLPSAILTAPIAAFGRRFGNTGSNSRTTSSGSSYSDDQQEIDDLLGEIVQSTECLERISCEIGRSVKTPQVRAIIDQSFSELNARLAAGPWKASLKGYIIGSNGRLKQKNVCIKFKCKIGKYLS